MWTGGQFRCGSDPHLEVVSEQQQRRAALCEWKSQRHRSGVCRSDGVHSLITKQILHPSNKREMSHTGLNNRNVVTSSVLVATYMRQKILQLYMEKCLSSCLSYQLFITFLHHKTASVPGCRARWLSQLNGGDYVMRFKKLELTMSPPLALLCCVRQDLKQHIITASIWYKQRVDTCLG